MIGILKRILFFEIIDVPINYNPEIRRVVNFIII